MTTKKSEEPTVSDLQKQIEKSAQMFDVAKPGKTAADATSRPIIVTHAPMIQQDPMVREKEAEDDKKTEVVTKVEIRREKKIMPLSEQKSEPASEEDVAKDDKDGSKTEPTEISLKDNEPGKGADEKAPEEPEEEKAPDPEPEEMPKTSLDSNEVYQQKDHSAEVDAVANEAAAKKGVKKEQDEYASRLAEAEKLVASKQYVVPIGQASRRRSHQLFLIGLILSLLLGLALLNFAIDAEALDIGVSALTDLL